MIKIFELVDYVRRNSMLVSVVALLVGTSWMLLALTIALFRDTIEPAGLSAAHASTHQPAYRAVARSKEKGEYYWFRQRKLDPYSIPFEHARND